MTAATDTPDPYLSDAEARRFTRHHLKRGAQIAPPLSRVYGWVLDQVDALQRADGVPTCGQPEIEGDAGIILIQTYGPTERAWRMLCRGCFDAEPLLPHCQICDRRPSPGLRTVLATEGPVVYVARICRDCRTEWIVR